MLNKNIINDALAEAKQIEKFAYEQAKKSLEESLKPQLEKLVLESINKMNSETSEEEIAEVVALNEEEVIETIETIADQSTITENNINPQNISEMFTEDNEELYEVSGLFEDGEQVQEPLDAAPVEADPIEAKLDDLLAKVDTLLSAAGDVGGEQASAEGEVEIIDDEATGEVAPEVAPEAVPAPAPAPAPAPSDELETVTEDDVMFEIDEIEDINEFDVVSETLDTDDEMYEIDLGDDIQNDNDDVYEINVDDEIEESRALSFTAKNRGERFNSKALPSHAPVTTPALNESKIKAQYESKLDELIKENTSLKGVIKNYKSNLKEFENGFVQLKSQLNEMQIFNGKLAYANKLLAKGGLTNDEKITIAEEFDKCTSVEDAKKLYNKLITESKFSSKETIADKIKIATPKTANAQTVISESKQDTAFESDERKRMRQLAGITKTN